MAGWQQMIVVGNVGRDPVFKYTPSGVAVCDFSVAVTRKFGGGEGEERQEKTTWFRVTCWRKLAETANQYVRKGSQIMVIGEVEGRGWLDKSGEPQASIDLNAHNFTLLGKREDGATGGRGNGAPPFNADDYPVGDGNGNGEIPF